MFLLKGRNKSLYSSAGVIGNIRLSRVDRRGVLPLVSYPSVNNFLSLNERSFLPHRKFALVHIFTFLFFVTLAMPSVAYATEDDAQWDGAISEIIEMLSNGVDGVITFLSGEGESYGNSDGFSGSGGGTFSGNTGAGGAGGTSSTVDNSHGTQDDSGTRTYTLVTNLGASGYSARVRDANRVTWSCNGLDGDNNACNTFAPTVAVTVDGGIATAIDDKLSNGYDVLMAVRGDGSTGLLHITACPAGTISGSGGSYSYTRTKSEMKFASPSSSATIFRVGVTLDSSGTTFAKTSDWTFGSWDTPTSSGNLLNYTMIATNVLYAAGGSSGDETIGTGGGESQEPSYPTDNPDYPSPTTPTAPDTSLPSLGEQTETTVDLSPVTNRQDVTNNLLYGIGTDLGSFYSMTWAEFDQIEAEIYDLGDYLGRYLYSIAMLEAQSVSLEQQIIDELQDLDHDTDGIDLTGINTRLDDILAALGASDAYDDSGLISVITGSHGTDLLGLFGRIDLICNWLDAYTGFDDSDLVTLLGDIYGTLNNLQDPDSGFATIRGDVRALLNMLTDIDELLDGWPDYPSSLDLSALEQYASDSLGELRDLASNFVSYWTDFDLRLDALLNAIKDLDFGTRYTPGGNPPRPTQTQIVQYVDWVEWDNAVETLMHKFPFVIVNDIAMIFAAITRPPVTPVFDLPMPNPSDWSQPYLVHVDLSDWDTVAAVMRVGIIIWVISRVSRRTLALFTRDEGAAA